MEKLLLRIGRGKNFLYLFMMFALMVTVGCAASGGGTMAEKSAAVMQPMEIPADVTCGKCGMYPAKYPRWQSQVIFADGSMTPFDGCKCMFNFLNAVEKFDKKHSFDDVAMIWVKDFNSGAWINATEANYVVGSDMMGPMGKELIPFAEKSAAMKFRRDHGGDMMKYAEINTDVLKSLGMGGMKTNKHMKM